MCTTQNPRMLRSGALNPAGGRGPDNTRPRWSPKSESSETRYRTGEGGQAGYKRLGKKPPPPPAPEPEFTPQVYDGDPYTPTAKERKSNPKYSGDPYRMTGARAKAQRDRDRNRP